MAAARVDYETRTFEVRLDDQVEPSVVADLRGAFESSGLVETIEE